MPAPPRATKVVKPTKPAAKTAKPSPWLAHVQAYRSAHGCSLKEAMQGASKTWERPSGAKEQHKPRSDPSYRGVKFLPIEFELKQATKLNEISFITNTASKSTKDSITKLVEKIRMKSFYVDDDNEMQHTAIIQGTPGMPLEVKMEYNKSTNVFYIKLRFLTETMKVKVYDSGYFHTSPIFTYARELWETKRENIPKP